MSSNQAKASYPMSGELLNDEYALLKHPLAPFDPGKTYRVTPTLNGLVVTDDWPTRLRTRK